MLRSKDFKYNIGEIIETNTGKIEVLDYIEKFRQGTTNYIKHYKYKCLIDGYIGDISEYHLKNKQGCSVCAKKVVVEGINDIATTNPEMLKYLSNIEYGYKYSYSSNKKVLCKCPYCNLEKEVSINYLYRRGFSCPRCGDGVSYPNKFVFNLLEQLNIEFETEKIFGWATDKRYDFYLPELNCIIEAHGLQHYEEGSKNSRYSSLSKQQENDKTKQTIAKINGIQQYIIINCQESNCDWIKNSIINSDLSKMFDLSVINWETCDKNGCGNLVKIICNYWNDGKNVIEISNIMKITRLNVVKHLKRGRDLGWCIYNPKSEMIKNSSKIGKANSKSIICIETNQIFDSLSECSRVSEDVFGTKLDYKNISLVCLGKRKHHKGYHFMFYEDFKRNND